LSVATQDEIVIHRLRLAEGYVALADTLFGVGRDFLVGIGQDQVWLAPGPGAQQLLGTKIHEAGIPEKNTNVLSATIKLGPWSERLHELAEQREKPEAVEDRAAWREHLLRMRQPAEFMTTDGEVILSLQSDGGSLEGTLHAGKGVQTFLGGQIARFTKE